MNSPLVRSKQFEQFVETKGENASNTLLVKVPLVNTTPRREEERTAAKNQLLRKHTTIANGFFQCCCYLE